MGGRGSDFSGKLEPRRDKGMDGEDVAGNAVAVEEN
jgi:hypothetical protein